jgi:hypothetical protein
VVSFYLLRASGVVLVVVLVFVGGVVHLDAREGLEGLEDLLGVPVLA